MTALAGTLRRCSLPGCSARYDALEVMEGRASAPGWRHGRMGLRLCGGHSWLWTSSAGRTPHLVAFVRPDGDHGALWLRCGCGSWELDTTGLTAGESAARYLAHLAEVVPPEGSDDE